MDAFERFSQKLELLLKQHQALEADNQRLRATIDGQNKVIQQLNRKVRKLEADMVSVDLGNTDADNKEDMRKQLDAVISEIDNILQTLND